MILRVGGPGLGSATPAAIQLGQAPPRSVPRPQAGAPTWTLDGDLIVVEGTGYRFVLDRSRAEFKADDPRHSAPLIRFPTPHLTRYDFGDLAGPSSPPYAVLPDGGTRRVEVVSMNTTSAGLEITVQDHYEGLTGHIRWLVDRSGMGEVVCEYRYTGPPLNAREVGIAMTLKAGCDELKWRRWSEWGVFPDDHIGRTEGTAKARRDPLWPDAPEGTRPAWPWRRDQTELGTNDFRSIKFNIYEASLVATDGSGIRICANADAHVRACLADKGVRLHVLSQCRLGPVVLKEGDRIEGRCAIEMLPAGRMR
jgi:hypothetical protein